MTSSFVVPFHFCEIKKRVMIGNRVAAFDDTGCKTPSVIFRFICKTVRQESSKFYRDFRNENNLEHTKH